MTAPTGTTDHVGSIRNRVYGAIAGFGVFFAIVLSYPLATPYASAIAMGVTAILAIPLVLNHARCPQAWLVILSSVTLVIASREPWTVGLGFAVITAFHSTRTPPPLNGMMRGITVAILLTSSVLLVDGTGLFWSETSRLSWRVTSWLTELAGEREQLAPNHFEAVWLVGALCLWVAQWPFSRKSWITQIQFVFVIVGAGAASIAFKQPALAIAMVPLIIWFGDWDASNLPRPWRLRRQRSCTVAGLASALGVLLSIAATTFHRSSNNQSAPVLGIVNEGMMTLDMADDQDFSLVVEAEFGGLKRLMPLYGWEVRILDPHEVVDALSHLTVLLVINPQRTIAESELAAIEAFVRNGGRLLVYGDHTDMGDPGIMGPLNALLGFTSIAFQFDSAIPLDTNWRWDRGVRGSFHPAFVRMDNEQFGISVGASLRVTGNARVLVVGDEGFSDHGNPDFGISRLGDMRYNYGEELGGLPLVAEERIGRGVVQVWGDTAGLQTLSLTLTGEFVAEQINHLAGHTPRRLPRQLIGGAMAILLFAVVIFLSPSLWMMVTTMLILQGTVSFVLLPIAAAGNQSPRSLTGAAIYDMTHGPAYPQPGPRGAIHVFAEVFIRKGDILLASHRDLSHTLSEAPETVVINSPSRPYSDREAEAIMQYVDQGGRLLVISGYEHHRAVKPILSKFDIQISSSMFGVSHLARLEKWQDVVLQGRQPEPPEFLGIKDAFLPRFDADLQFKESNPIVAPYAVPLVTSWDEPIVVYQLHGLGCVVVIADPRFVCNENLRLEPENLSPVDTRNVQFLLQILDL